jgi:hypothetical protein
LYHARPIGSKITKASGANHPKATSVNPPAPDTNTFPVELSQEPIWISSNKDELGFVPDDNQIVSLKSYLKAHVPNSNKHVHKVAALALALHNLLGKKEIVEKVPQGFTAVISDPTVTGHVWQAILKASLEEPDSKSQIIGSKCSVNSSGEEEVSKSEMPPKCSECGFELQCFHLLNVLQRRNIPLKREGPRAQKNWNLHESRPKEVSDLVDLRVVSSHLF